MEKVYISWNQPNNGESGTKHFSHALISINRLLNRRSQFKVQNWILDSGAFTRLSNKSSHLSTRKYAKIANFFYDSGNLEAVVTQDYLPIAKFLRQSKLTVKQCQQLTVNRYELLQSLLRPEIYQMPVLQGIEPSNYAQHLQLYQARILPEAWVGVGNLVGRSISEIEEIVVNIAELRKDIRLHGFGIKLSHVKNPLVKKLFYSSDSANGSFSQDNWRRSHNRPDLAIHYQQKILKQDARSLNLLQYQRLKEIEDCEMGEQIAYVINQMKWNQAYLEDTDSNIYEPSFATPWD